MFRTLAVFVFLFVFSMECVAGMECVKPTRTEGKPWDIKGWTVISDTIDSNLTKIPDDVSLRREFGNNLMVCTYAFSDSKKLILKRSVQGYVDKTSKHWEFVGSEFIGYCDTKAGTPEVCQLDSI